MIQTNNQATPGPQKPVEVLPGFLMARIAADQIMCSAAMRFYDKQLYLP